MVLLSLQKKVERATVIARERDSVRERERKREKERERERGERERYRLERGQEYALYL